MGDLAIRAVGDRRGPEQRCRLALRKPWQEPIEPGQECLRRQQAPHALGFDSAEDWKSSPLGSPQAGQSVSSPYQRWPVSRSSVASACIL